MKRRNTSSKKEDERKRWEEEMNEESMEAMMTEEQLAQNAILEKKLREDEKELEALLMNTIDNVEEEAEEEKERKENSMVCYTLGLGAIQSTDDTVELTDVTLPYVNLTDRTLSEIALQALHTFHCLYGRVPPVVNVHQEEYTGQITCKYVYTYEGIKYTGKGKHLKKHIAKKRAAVGLLRELFSKQFQKVLTIYQYLDYQVHQTNKLLLPILNDELYCSQHLFDDICEAKQIQLPMIDISKIAPDKYRLTGTFYLRKNEKKMAETIAFDQENIFDDLFEKMLYLIYPQADTLRDVKMAFYHEKFADIEVPYIPYIIHEDEAVFPNTMPTPKRNKHATIYFANPHNPQFQEHHHEGEHAHTLDGSSSTLYVPPHRNPQHPRFRKKQRHSMPVGTHPSTIRSQSKYVRITLLVPKEDIPHLTTHYHQCQ